MALLGALTFHANYPANNNQRLREELLKLLSDNEEAMSGVVP
jgi:hypothetical protein